MGASCRIYVNRIIRKIWALYFMMFIMLVMECWSKVYDLGWSFMQTSHLPRPLTSPPGTRPMYPPISYRYGTTEGQRYQTWPKALIMHKRKWQRSTNLEFGGGHREFRRGESCNYPISNILVNYDILDVFVCKRWPMDLSVPKHTRWGKIKLW